jgi:hypothetical protein
MVIRHAEKPDGAGTIFGITESGIKDPTELTVRGWQRAGALAQLFSPAGVGGNHSRLEVPAAIFATAATALKKSLRPQHTVNPLAEKLGLALATEFANGDETKLIAAAKKVTGSVLICWHHEKIPAIAAGILGPEATFPRKWPDERFDLVWVFVPVAGGWRLEQVPQMLLTGDSPAPIKEKTENLGD